MALINLLPWREQRRELQQRQLVLAFASSILLALFIILIMHTVIARQFHSQATRNQTLQNKIDLLDRKIQKIQGLQQQKESQVVYVNNIRALQKKREEIMILFAEFTRILPEGIYLKTIKQQAGLVTLIGKAQSNAEVSMLMRNITGTQSLIKPMLTEIKREEISDGYNYSFILQAQLKSSNENIKVQPNPYPESSDDA